MWTGEIQKGTGGRGRDRKCHKLSQIVVTFLTKFLWRFMTFFWRFYVNGTKRTENCHKMSQIVVKCRKLLWRFSQIVVTIFSRPLPAVPFGFHRVNLFVAINSPITKRKINRQSAENGEKIKRSRWEQGVRELPRTVCLEIPFFFRIQKMPRLGRTRRGSYSWKGVFLPSKCLLQSSCVVESREIVGINLEALQVPPNHSPTRKMVLKPGA